MSCEGVGDRHQTTDNRQQTTDDSKTNDTSLSTEYSMLTAPEQSNHDSFAYGLP